MGEAFVTRFEGKGPEAEIVKDMARHAATSEKSIESMLTRAREAFRATFTALAHNLDVAGTEPAA